MEMSEGEVQEPDTAEEAAPQPRRRRWRIPAVVAVLLGLALAVAWYSREEIANKIIMGKLEDLGLPATYQLESVGPRHQVLLNIVIGDPAHPDLTIERAEVEIEPSFGLPTIGKVMLTRPRLYGSFRQARFSFGALDKLLQGGTEPGKGLPDLDLTLIDGRARLETDYGVIGAKAEGAGNLRGGFSGIVAGIGPALNLGGCTAQRVSLYGKLTVQAAQPRFAGPVRLQSLSCSGQALALGAAGARLDLRLASSLDAVSGSYDLTGGPLAVAGNRAARIAGKGQFSFKGGDLTAAYDLAGESVELGAVHATRLGAVGTLRSHDRFAGLQSDGKLSGAELRPAPGLGAALAGLERSGQGSLLAPLAAQLRAALAREAHGSIMGADYVLRRSGALTNLMLPAALVRGGSGAHLLALSRASLTLGEAGGPRFSGHVATGGAGIPEIEGMVERSDAGGADARLTLRDYAAGTSRIALPELRLVQLPNGALGFAGSARLSGALPGGQVENLTLPLDGNWSAAGGLALWRRCTTLRFDQLRIANLALDRRALMLCPGSDGAILRSDARGMRIAAGTGSLDLAGTLGTTPVRLQSRAVGLAWPGNLVANGLKVALGPPATPTTLAIARLDAVLGKAVTGRFAGAELKLSAVPIDVVEANGDWRLAGGDLSIGKAALTVKDREKQPRFEPLVARDAALLLHSARLTADAVLHEPKSDRVVVETRIAHDLDTASGHADLLVPGITFDQKLQPTTLTYYAQGVVALAQGAVRGRGRIDWSAKGVTSNGDLSTDGLDFAAAFGLVKGTRGTVHFTDLLGLVTAPDQRLRLAAINPGIEVNDGEVSFQLEPGHVLRVNGAHWPFIDGTLALLPTRMVLGAAEVRRYTLQVVGINAAKFVQHLDLSNISATGIFDGSLPLVFDQQGGRIEHGLLVSRPPGGNVSYVGELTYKDLSAMGNFAFQTLRSLDFRRMEIGLDGHIDGEIVTAMRIDGVRQGAGAKRNFLTQRLAHLPIRFNITIRAPFYQLVTSFRGLYDPSYIRDPRSLGLVGANGTPAQARQKEQHIQHPDSRTRP